MNTKLKYVRYCPACRSKNVVLFSGGITGSYECKDCGYISAVFGEIKSGKAKIKVNRKRRGGHKNRAR